MKKLLLAAVAVAALVGATVVANAFIEHEQQLGFTVASEVGSWQCKTDLSSTREPYDPDPTVNIQVWFSIKNYGNIGTTKWKDGDEDKYDIFVKHQTRSGKIYDRTKQYKVVAAYREEESLVWEGIAGKDPNVLIEGRLSLYGTPSEDGSGPKNTYFVYKETIGTRHPHEYHSIVSCKF